MTSSFDVGVCVDHLLKLLQEKSVCWEEIRSVGERIHRVWSTEGLRVVGGQLSARAYKRKLTGRLRELDFAWSGIGDWQA